MIRILIWATHLQTDILALAAYLDRRPDFTVLIVTPDADTFRREPFARYHPLKAPLLDRNDPETYRRVLAFGADVAIADNHIPPRGCAPRLFYMWHGLGWKARSPLDLQIFYHQVKQLIGCDPRIPNPCFRAQCYGPSDRQWRIERWHLPPSACVEIGMTFSDLLLDPPYKRQDIASEFRIDILNRPTIALAVTWHTGGIFASVAGHSRSEAMAVDSTFLSMLTALARKREANLLICLHDRHRYGPEFLMLFEQLELRNPFVEVRFKSEHPDNMIDLLAADLMISNLSSFMSYFYLLGRPAIHILPSNGAKQIERVAMLFSRFRVHRRFSPDKAWMLSPTDTGGLNVTSGQDVIAATNDALDELSSSNQAAEDWLHRHVAQIDGHTAERFASEILKLCGRDSSPQEYLRHDGKSRLGPVSVAITRRPGAIFASGKSASHRIHPPKA